jgi:hypothetical protein
MPIHSTIPSLRYGVVAFALLDSVRMDASFGQAIARAVAKSVEASLVSAQFSRHPLGKNSRNADKRTSFEIPCTLE